MALGSCRLGRCAAGDSGELLGGADPGATEVALGQGVGSPGGTVPHEAQLLPCRGKPAESKLLFPVSLRGLLLGRVGMIHSHLPRGKGVTER